MTPQQLIYKCNSWKDLEARISKFSPKKRGTVFEWLCVFYLQIDPRYRTTYKRVLHSSQYLKENKFKKILGLTYNKEEGADAIAERYDGKIDIIQCKYLDSTSKNLTKGHIESPLEIANGKNAKPYVDTILMCSNAKDITRSKDLRDRHPNLQFRTLLGGDFKQLSREDFSNIRKVIDNLIPEYKSKEPFEHQKIARESILKHFKNESRGQVIHACGTGKTLTSYFAFRELKPKLCLYVVPSLQLINQTLIEWTKESLADGVPISPFVVCSDKSNEKIGECDPELWMQELGIRVSNKKEDLEVFLKSKRTNKVIFATYQSGKVFAKNISALNRHIDFAFFDEAHNTATSKEKLSSHLLFDENIKIKKRLFMTATPKRLVGTNNRIASMDDEEIYGQVINEITVKDAIEGIGGKKLLNDYSIVTQIESTEKYRELLKENPFVVDKKRLPEEVELKLLASVISLKKLRKERNIRNTVSFHGRRNRANAFRQGAKEIDGDLNTYYVDGNQSGTERLDILEDFSSNPPSLVTNAQCLSEGVNVPSIDAVMFVDPKQSKVDITQAIGRALRKGDKNKGLSYIIVPTIINKNSPDQIDEAYQQILMVLRAMSEHDGRLVEYFRLIREGKKPPKKFFEITGENLPVDFNLEDFTEKLNIKAWDRVARLGRRPWEQAKQLVQELGIKTSTEYRKFMRSEDAPKDMPIFPEQRYKEWNGWNNFLGTPNIRERNQEFLIYLKLWVDQNTNPVPEADVVIDGYGLGEKFRSVKNSHDKNTLEEDILAECLTIHPDIFNKTHDDFNWDIRFEAWKSYKKKFKKDLAPKGTVHNGQRVDIFAAEQKIRYKALKTPTIRRKPLKEYQLILLEKEGFDFRSDYEKKWLENYESAKKAIIAGEGKIPDKKKYSKDKAWVTKQRTRFKAGKLTEKEIMLLLKIPYFTFDPFADALKKQMIMLKAYVEDTGDTTIAQSTIYLGENLGGFLTKCRDKFRKGKLEENIIKEFEKIGVPLKPKSKKGFITEY